MYYYLWCQLYLDRQIISFRELAVFGPYIRQGEYYRLITGTFIHANIAHLIFNMYALWIIGIQLESFLGKWKYLLIYLFSGLTASLMSITFHNTTVSVGASGAIFWFTWGYVILWLSLQSLLRNCY